MKKNTSNVDRIVRVLIAIVLTILNVTGIAGPPASILLWLVVGIFIVTALAGSCPVYSLFGINTYTRKKDIKQYHE